MPEPYPQEFRDDVQVTRDRAVVNMGPSPVTVAAAATRLTSEREPWTDPRPSWFLPGPA